MSTKEETGSSQNGFFSLTSNAKYDPNSWSEEEKTLRKQMSYAFRILAHRGLNNTIYNHVVVRLPHKPEEPEHYLVNPWGFSFDEITPENIVKIDGEGNIIDPGSEDSHYNYTGAVIHCAIHRGRPDLLCSVHVHSTSGVAVSCMKFGLLPINQDAHYVGGISYHDYYGTSVRKEEQELIIKSLGPTNNVLIMRNHGLLTCGRSVAAALGLMLTLHKACDIQVMALSAGLDNLIMPPKETMEFNHVLLKKLEQKKNFYEADFGALCREVDRYAPQKPLDKKFLINKISRD